MINSVDVVVCADFGDSGKGKVVSHLSSFKHKTSGMLRTEKKHYDWTARFAGGQNAGHTVFHNGSKYKTHVVPSGIFNGIKSLIGPGCVLNLDLLVDELNYLENYGFNTDLVKISPMTHLVTAEHIEFDRVNLATKFGTTSKGIAPAYGAKYLRTGQRFDSLIGKGNLSTFSVGNKIRSWSDYLFEGQLHGNVLCEGAQGFYLDTDWGDYPFTTSSVTLAYGACSLGFSPKKIRNIYATAKIYSTRSGQDEKNFPETLFDDNELSLIGEIGQEYGTTTGRRRKVNFLNLDRLIFALNTGGGTHIIISKCDVLEEANIFKVFYKNELIKFSSILEIKSFITARLSAECAELSRIYYSYSPETVEGLTI